MVSWICWLSVLSSAVTLERKLSMPRNGASALSMLDFDLVLDVLDDAERLRLRWLLLGIVAGGEKLAAGIEDRHVVDVKAGNGRGDEVADGLAALRPASAPARIMTEAVGFCSALRKLPTSGMTMWTRAAVMPLIDGSCGRFRLPARARG